MLRVYDDALGLIRDLAPVLRELAHKDASLADQLRRALASVPLNLAEGSMMSGKNRNLRYRTALGSLRESLACLEVASALGELAPVAPALRDRIEKIKATLLNVVR